MMSAHMKANREHLMKLQNSLIKSAQISTCTNCEEWDKEKQICKKFNILPPAEVIVTGCVMWIDEIPF